MDSRIVAARLGIEHEYLIRLVYKYEGRLEKWGLLRFENGVGYRPQGGGNPQKYALLNENQALALVTRYARARVSRG